MEFDNLNEFFARVSGQIEQTQYFSFSAPVDDKTSVTQKSPSSTKMLSKTKNDIERLLFMPSQDLLLAANCSMLNEALSTYTASPNLLQSTHV